MIALAVPEIHCTRGICDEEEVGIGYSSSWMAGIELACSAQVQRLVLSMIYLVDVGIELACAKVWFICIELACAKMVAS